MSTTSSTGTSPRSSRTTTTRRWTSRFRASSAEAHTDFGGLTVLYQQDDTGGLQVLQGEDTWRDVRAVPGSFVINIGDLMALWTGGRWVSTMHRVINPVQADTSSRISIPFFFQPNHDALVEPLPSLTSTPDRSQPVPVIAGEWMTTKMQKLFAPAE
ncbi:2OG-Fe(II) oxygenase family protein [Actinomadura sp. LOL_016]|uniref:2OG-Fe(II) oxygenase family protein n=1 Tax=unclassified Actinomadura TaxID=2626254 RepID=UPI003A802A6F